MTNKYGLLEAYRLEGDSPDTHPFFAIVLKSFIHKLDEKHRIGHIDHCLAVTEAARRSLAGFAHRAVLIFPGMCSH